MVGMSQTASPFDAHNYSMRYILSPFYLIIIIVNPDLRMFFLLMFRERVGGREGGEREKERE